MTVREIHFGSPEFDAECDLRQRVLRAPLGLDLYDEDLELEKNQLHFGLFDSSGLLVACVIAAPLASTQAKIRQMAVSTERQRRGLGRDLLNRVEAILRARGIASLTLHARLSAIEFYRCLGYTASGGTFIEVGLPHVEMRKELSDTEAG